MKTRFLQIVFSALILNSCSDKEETTDQDIPLNKDSLILKKEVLLSDGPYIEKYPEGQTRIAGEIKNGKRFGQWTAYYPDGTKQSEDFFEDGKKNGKTATFYKNGRVRYIGYFLWDKPNGAWEFYDTLGNVATKKEYK